jgi:predicted N-formylglutamate amidohydrolase
MTKQGPFAGGGPILADSGAQSAQDSYELIEGDLDCGLLLLADHASNHIPADYGDLGLSEATRRRHIAYDIGVGPLTRDLAERFNAPALVTTFSRLIIDPNRGEDDPTLIMRLSDGDVVPGNAAVDAAERERRLDRFYRPYHAALERTIDAMLATGQVPAILSVHSYTPIWKGMKRPWHAGLLWDSDPRFSRALLDALRAEHGLRVGDNEPYSGALKNDTMYRHASSRGLAHALLEVRNDLIETPAGVLEWADRLEPLLREILEDQTLHEIRHYGSAADGGGGRGDEGDDHAATGHRYAHRA